MNKIVQRIQPVMNDTELAAVIDDHYTAEAQTLTTGAEANLLNWPNCAAPSPPHRRSAGRR